MVHEFARRAGDMRMELSAKSSWPIDLELDGFEISRLAVLVLEAAPAYSLFTSIETFGDRICLDKLVLYTSAKAFHILHLSGIRASRSMEIEGYPFSHQWFQSIRMSQLVSLSLTCIYVEDVNSLLSNLTAPLLREIKFDHLEINYGLESDVDEDVQPEDLVDLAGFKEQITTLTIIECRESAWLSIADHSIMSSLTSLTLVTDYLFMYGSDGDTAENSASTFLHNCPQLENLDISVTCISLRNWTVIWEDRGNGISSPKLRTFRLYSLYGGDVGKHRDADQFSQELISRSKRPGVRPLRRLEVSRYFIRDEDEEELRTCAEELVLLR